ncbi:transcription factor HES-2 [Thomomys bottae]
MGVPRRVGDAAEQRKSLKPLLEKRRRARINESLSQLRALLLPLAGRENSRRSKLEKAGILEMTVHFLKELPAAPGLPEPTPSDSYSEGYRACLARLARARPTCRALEPALSARLLEHLQRKSGQAGDSGLQPPPPTTSPAPAPEPSRPAPAQDPGLWRPW